MTPIPENWAYGDVVKDHFFHPQNFLRDDTGYTADGIGMSGSPTCGDMMVVWIKVDDESKRIKDCKWQTFGCASAIASTSMMSVMTIENGGMTLEEAETLKPEQIVERLGGLPERKFHCSCLVTKPCGKQCKIIAIKMLQNNETINNNFVLTEVRKETTDVSTFRFAPEDREMFPFTAGQFISLYLLDDIFGGQGKNYTISSLPGENFLEITVKKLGEFSSGIHNLKLDSKVKIIGPSGNFFPTPEMSDLVFLAGGIGIVPFHIILQDLARAGGLAKRKIQLFHSNKRRDGIVFSEKFVKLSKQFKNFQVIYTLTQEKSADPPVTEERRIDWEMIKKYSGEPEDKSYFICGSISFVRDVWQKLKRSGVKEQRILTESFY